MNMKINVLFCIATLLLSTACDRTESPVEVPDHAEEVIVRANCDILQEAVEVFARGNFMEYPSDATTDVNTEGKTVRDLLPEESLLRNPYSGSDVEPSGETADAPGAIGYSPVMTDDYYDGYVITGYGKSSIIVTIEKAHTAEEAQLRENCIALCEAAEAFASENRLLYACWPVDDPNEAGRTLIDYLPGGEYLINPYTGERTEPNHRYYEPYPGSLQYQPKVVSNYPVGFALRAHGVDTLKCGYCSIPTPEYESGIVMANCFTVRDAAELFAAENGGAYAQSVADCTPFGNTMVDLFPNGRLLLNPYTKLVMEPAVWGGAAAQPGEIGYNAICIAAVPVGYVITGVGEYLNNIITLTNEEELE